MIRTIIPTCFFSAFALASCSNTNDKTPDSKTILLLKIDSLNDVIDVNQKFTTTLVQVGQLMDSIDDSRDMIRINLEEADPAENYLARMREINQYIKASNAKLSELERSVRKGDKQMKAYVAIIKTLKHEISVKTLEVSRLKQEVDEFKVKTAELALINNTQEKELRKREDVIVKQENEINEQSTQIEETEHELKLTQAEQYFKQAEALELAAKRTKLAPRKKKATMKKALELYRQSLAAGNRQAQTKIDELAEKIN
jgi:hypothetical protein